MNIDTKAMVSITDANHNFSKVTKAVGEFGYALILKNHETNLQVTNTRNMDEEDVEKMINKAMARKKKQ